MDFTGNKKIQIRIVTPERVVYTAACDSINLPTESGEITILPHHEGLVTLAKPGVLTVTNENESQYFSLNTGVIQIGEDNTVTILVTHSEVSDAIDLARAEEAYSRAKKAMEEKSTLSDMEFAQFQGSLEKNLARIKTARRRL